MTMTKALTLSWFPPSDPVLAIRADHERVLKIINMELDGKTVNHRKAVIVKKNTIQRQWRDQEAVDEYIEFMYNLANKYRGTVVVGELVNLKGE